MPLIPIDLSKKAKISPPPVHDTIVSDSRPTEVFTRFLIDLMASGRNVYEEINRVIAQVNLNIEKINKIQVGAGLEDDGDYAVPIGTNYIDLTTTLSDADSTLDTALYDNVRELITPASVSIGLMAISQTVLCDATSGAINITLPSPASCFSNNRSLKIGISKIDTTSNIVTILPSATELIVGEISQSINSEGDILNFITDGTNWYLQN